MNLLEASHQWARRPADERFVDMRSMREVCHGYYESAKETSTTSDQLDIGVTDKDDLRFIVRDKSRGDRSARFTHWSFGQFCRILKTPADYMRGLPSDLVVQNLRHGINKYQEVGHSPLKLLTHLNGGNILRGLTSTGYARIWNWEIIDRLLELDDGWIVPPARPALPNQPGTRKATEVDVLPNQENFGLSVSVGDDIAPAGLYASDHDMFVFMVKPGVITNDGSELGLMRGIFISNSEVGAQSLKITKFKLRAVCGNHICWDASHVLEVRVIHRGAADERFVKEMSIELKRYGEEGVAEEEEAIRAAQKMILGKDKNEVLDTLFGIKNLGPTLGQLDEAFEVVVQHEDTDGNPLSVWGMVNGLSRLSQRADHMDSRVRLDRAAGRIMDLIQT